MFHVLRGGGPPAQGLSAGLLILAI